MSNPANPAPRKAPITGLTFQPTQIVSNGSRVWMTGAVGGGGGVPIAYIDVPSDPFTTSFAATTVSATFGQGVGGFFLLPLTGQSALLVGPTSPFEATVVAAPLAPPVNLVGTPLGAPTTSSPTVTSGTRLLMAANTAGTAGFNLVSGAGSATPQSGPVTVFGAITAVSTSRSFASSEDGAVFWATGVTQTDAGDTVTTRAAQGAFLLDSATGQIPESVTGLDLDVYADPVNPIGQNATVVGPSALLDANTAMVTTMAHENPLQTAVQFVKRTPLALVKEADGVTPRRAVLTVPASQVVAATASNGIGYVVANDPAPPNPATLFVFDPGCAP
jgi:hypothetical protein